MLREVNYPDIGAIGYELPVCLHCPNPQYPATAFDARAQGLVELSVVIEPNGRADNIVVRKHLREDLDISAEQAVETWIFKPAIGPNGKPSAVHMLIEVNFQWH